MDFYYADLYSVQDYDPFGMIQVGRSWKRKDYRFSFNGKEDETWQVQDFDARMYDKLACRWLSIDPVVHPYQSPFAAFANNPIYYTDPTGTTEYPTSGDYKKANPQGKGDGSDGHWLTSDRNASNEVWKKANEVNLNSTYGYLNYTSIPQRTDFYKWFQTHTESKGFETKWAGAAYKVASDINKLETLALCIDWGFSSVGLGNIGHELKAFAHKGNRMIFEDVFPKLQQLASGKVLKGQDAFNWDAQATAEEQNLIQPLYTDFLSKGAFGRLDDVSRRMGGLPLLLGALFSETPKFPYQASLKNVGDRWTFGMKGMGYNVNTLSMPSVNVRYSDQTIYNKLFTPLIGFYPQSTISLELK